MNANKAKNASLFEDSNPFYFSPNSLQTLGVKIDSSFVEPPLRVQEWDEDGGGFIEPYLGLLRSLRLHNTNEDIDITPKKFGDGMTLFGFDLSSDRSQSSRARSIQSLTLELDFAEPTPRDGLVGIVMAIFQGEIEILSDRSVNVYDSIR